VRGRIERFLSDVVARVLVELAVLVAVVLADRAGVWVEEVRQAEQRPVPPEDGRVDEGPRQRGVDHPEHPQPRLLGASGCAVGEAQGVACLSDPLPGGAVIGELILESDALRAKLGTLGQ